MPIYEFHCAKCGRESEVLVRSTDWAGTKCPRCGSSKLEKKLSVFASGSAAEPADAGCAATGGKSGGCGCACGGGRHQH
jgi:putative FmdB family regulatory protein